MRAARVTPWYRNPADVLVDNWARKTTSPRSRSMSGQVPPAGPQWVRGLAMPDAHALSYDKPLCASLDGFTLHAATRAGGFDDAGREALLRYVLRPPIAQE